MKIKYEKIDITLSLSIGDKFNDFNSKTIFDVEIINWKKSINLSAKIVFKENIHDEIVDSHQFFNKNGISGGDFYISFLNKRNYKLLLEFLGRDKFDHLLDLIEDVNYINFNKKFFLETEVVLTSLLRDDDSYELFNNFEEVFLNDNYIIPNTIALGDNSKGYFISIDEASKVVNGNVFGIIGINGVGKSFTLNAIAKKIALNNNFYRVIGFSTTKESDKTFSPISGEKFLKFKNVDSESINDKNAAKLIYDISRLGGGKIKFFLDLCKFVLSYERLVFIDEGGGSYNVSEIYLGGKQQILRKVKYLKHLSLKVVKKDGIPRDPSSGEITCFKVILGVLLCIRNDSVLLFDEIENHLHPNYITRIVYSISKILSEYNCVAIFSTHSPYVVREMVDSNVYIMKDSLIDDGKEFLKPSIKTLGADLQELSNFIFEDDFVSLVLTDFIKDKNIDIDSIDYVSDSARLIINSGV